MAFKPQAKGRGKVHAAYSLRLSGETAASADHTLNGSLMHSPTQPKTQAQYFRAKSVECLERSLRVPDPEYQRLYCELAAQWLVLAHEAESDEACVVVVTASKKESPSTGGANARHPKLEAPLD